MNNVYKSITLIQLEMMDDQFLQGATAQQKEARTAMKNEFFQSRMRIEQCSAILHTFSEPITKFESDLTPVSDVIVEFTNLAQKLNELEANRVINYGEKQFINSLIEGRKQFIVKDIHRIGLALDPRYQTAEHLTIREENETLTKITNYFVKSREYSVTNVETHQYSPQVLQGQLLEFSQYCNQERTAENFYYQQLLSKQIHLSEFWLSFKPRWPALAEVAIRTFSGNCSTADVESSFSIENIVHNPQRSLLSFEKTEKTVFIKFNFNRNDCKVCGVQFSK